jgi:hypothetical protein
VLLLASILICAACSPFTPCYGRHATSARPKKIKKTSKQKHAMQPAPRSRLKKPKSARATHGKNRAMQNKEACSKKLLWPPHY